MDEVVALQSPVRRFVASRVRNKADADDVVQQVLLRACQGFARFRGGNLEQWLLTIARNVIADHYRGADRHRSVSLEVTGEVPCAADADADVLEQAHCRDRIRCWVECVILHLTTQEQVAVLLTDLHGHRNRDSAALLGLSLPSFKLLLHKARVRLHGVAGGSCDLLRSMSAAAGLRGGGGCGDGATRCTCESRTTCRVKRERDARDQLEVDPGLMTLTAEPPGGARSPYPGIRAQVRAPDAESRLRGLRAMLLSNVLP